MNSTAVSSGFDRQRFNQTLDTLTRSQRTVGNQTKWLFDDAESFAERMRLLDGAKHTIHIETYILTNDATGRTLTEMLCSKSKQGVKVRVLIDGWGTSSEVRPLLEQMRAAGVEVRVYHPRSDVFELNHRLHGKQLTVDGKVTVIGGRNYADAYSNRGPLPDGVIPWRDTDSEIAGPAVAFIQDEFVRNWELSGARLSKTERRAAFPTVVPNKNGVAIRTITHHPDEDGDDNIGKLYATAIRASSKSVNISSAYFIPNAEVREALIDRAKHGVKVRILTNSTRSSDVFVVAAAARYHYPVLLAAGVEIYEERSRTLHAKTASFDGAVAICGSANLDSESLSKNIEIDSVIEDEAFAHAHDAQFEKDLGEATLVTQSLLDAQPWYMHLMTDFFHLFEFLL